MIPTSRILLQLGTSAELALCCQRLASSQVPVHACAQQLNQALRTYHVSLWPSQQRQQQDTTEEAAPSGSSTGFGADDRGFAAGAASSSSSSTTSQQQQQQQQQQEGGESTTGTAQEGESASAAGADFKQKMHSGFDQFRSGFDQFKSKLGGSGGGAGGQGEGEGQGAKEDVGSKVKRLWATMRKEVADAVLPREEKYSATRVYEGELYQAKETDGSSAVAVVKRKETAWEKTMKQMQEKFGHHPIFQRVSKVNVADAAPIKKAGELAEDLKEKWENSDHPFVHKVEDVKARLFDPSDQARTMQEIHSRDPAFDMSRFIQAVRADAPVVVKAFLTHDLATLKKHCGPELMERFDGIFNHFAAQGLFEDPNILHTSEVELVEMKMVDEDPLVVVRFNCFQLKCTRDKFGNVVEGSPESIQRVYYFWGLQQEKQALVAADGKVVPPRWVLKDMMWQSMLALV